MYKILGADRNEYGPVAADQVRQWISEHRLNAQSLARLEGTEDWKPLAQFPEFADALATPVPATLPQALATLSPLPSAAMNAPRTNPMALTGFIMGLLTCVMCCCYGMPFNILSIVFSSIALYQISQNPEVEKGKGFAIAGLIISIVGTILIILMVVIYGALNFDEILRQIKR